MEKCMWTSQLLVSQLLWKIVGGGGGGHCQETKLQEWEDSTGFFRMWYSVSLLVMINFKEHSLSLKLTKILLRNNDAVISTLILPWENMTEMFSRNNGAFTEAENFFPSNWITNNKFSSFRAALEEKCCVGVNCARAGGPVIEKNFDS